MGPLLYLLSYQSFISTIILKNTLFYVQYQSCHILQNEKIISYKENVYLSLMKFFYKKESYKIIMLIKEKKALVIKSIQYINQIQNNNKMQPSENPFYETYRIISKNNQQQKPIVNQNTPTFIQNKSLNPFHSANIRSASQPLYNRQIQINRQEPSNQIKLNTTIERGKQKRRNRIFQSYNSPQALKSKEKRNRTITIFGRSPEKAIKKEILDKKQNQPIKVQQLNEKQPKQDVKLENKAVNSISIKKPVRQIFSQSTLNIQLSKKQHQINIIKLQIQRYKKCEELSYQNSLLSKKIAQKLKDTGTSNYYEQKKHTLLRKKIKSQDAYTPIGSLLNIQSYNEIQIQENAKIIEPESFALNNSKNKLVATYPLITIQQNQSFKEETEGSKVQFCEYHKDKQYITKDNEIQNQFKQINIMLAKSSGQKEKGHDKFEYSQIGKQIFQMNRSIEQKSQFNHSRRNMISSRESSAPKRKSMLKYDNHQGNSVFSKTWYNNRSQF